MLKDLDKELLLKILLTSMRAKFVDYYRSLRWWRQNLRSLSFPSLIYAFKFRDARFYWLVNNGYYARRRIPAFKDSIGRYLELKGNGARRDGTTKYHDDAGEGEETRKSPSFSFVAAHEFYGSSMLIYCCR